MVHVYVSYHYPYTEHIKVRTHYRVHVHVCLPLSASVPDVVSSDALDQGIWVAGSEHTA